MEPVLGAFGRGVGRVEVVESGSVTSSGVGSTSDPLFELLEFELPRSELLISSLITLSIVGTGDGVAARVGSGDGAGVGSTAAAPGP